MTDCLVIGGGVIGLSIAYELAGRGRRVRVLDAGQPGREASWAGAGMLPPASPSSPDPLEQLAALSNRLHAEWAAELQAATQIDNGFRRCGAIYLAQSASVARGLEFLSAWARARDITAERLSAEALARLEPALHPDPTPVLSYLVPAECQLRNPRHLKALEVGCATRGVEITAGASVVDFEVRGNRVRSARSSVGDISADQFCVSAGAWSGAVAGRLGLNATFKPIRGQIALLATSRPVVSRIINAGSRYLVPRPDGRLLVGSTEEDVGFDRRTTAQAIADLLAFAISLVPELAAAPLERSWAGLRPSTSDGLPYVGRVPDLDNAYLAAGHFRGGLQLSTGTAIVMRQLMTGQQPEIDLSPFRLDRGGSNEGRVEAATGRARSLSP